MPTERRAFEVHVFSPMHFVHMWWTTLAILHRWAESFSSSRRFLSSTWRTRQLPFRRTRHVLWTQSPETWSILGFLDNIVYFIVPLLGMYSFHLLRTWHLTAWTNGYAGDRIMGCTTAYCIPVVKPTSKKTRLFQAKIISETARQDQLRNAKTKAASSGRFELDPSSLRPTFLCCLFLCFRRFTYPTPISPPFWLDPSPAVTVPRKP